MRTLSYRQRTKSIGEAIIEWTADDRTNRQKISVEVSNPEEGLLILEKHLKTLNMYDSFKREIKVYRQTYLS